MARTVQNIIDELKETRFPWLSTAEALKYVNYTHKEMIGAVPALQRMGSASPTSIPITAGTREYALALTLNQIDRVEFTIGSTITKLDGTSIEAINRQMAGDDTNEVWLGASATENPTEFYISHQAANNYIGLNPLPVANGTLKVYGSQMLTLGLSDQVLPLFSDEVYIEGASFRLMKAKRKASWAGYYAAYMSLMDEVKRWTQSFSESYQNTGEIVNGREK